LTKQYKGGYDPQSVQSPAIKLSCNKTSLKRCTKTLLCSGLFRIWQADGERKECRSGL